MMKPASVFVRVIGLAIKSRPIVANMYNDC